MIPHKRRRTSGLTERSRGRGGRRPARIGRQSSQGVPTGSALGGDAGCGGIQPCGLFPVCAHPVLQGCRALGDAGFAAPDAQEVSNARLSVGRQGQEFGVEQARADDVWDDTPPNPRVP